MLRLPPLDLLIWCGSIGLAAVFALAALAKLRDREQARQGLAAFGVPARWAPAALAALIVAELLLSALLLAPRTRQSGALGALLALTVFTLAILWQLQRGRRPVCACFGGISRAAIGGWSVGRNLLLALAAALLAARPAGASPSAAFAVALPALVALSWAGLSAAWLLLLTRQNGRLLLRIEQLERRAEGSPAPAAPAAPLRVGDVLPPLGLSDARGRALEPPAGRGRPTLLLFLDGGCAHCRPLLARLREGPRLDAALAVISADPALQEQLPAAATLLLDPGWTTMARFSLRGTPAAAVVAADGTLARPAVHGGPAVAALLDQYRPQEARHEAAPV